MKTCSTFFRKRGGIQNTVNILRPCKRDHRTSENTVNAQPEQTQVLSHYLFSDIVPSRSHFEIYDIDEYVSGKVI